MKPYLIRAIYEWITDNHWTPYILVDATHNQAHLPEQHINEGRILLNICHQAVFQLEMGNEIIEFNAKFGGMPMQVSFAVDAVLSIYAQENGRGMVFDASTGDNDSPSPNPDSSESQSKSKRPHLRIVK
jgi:stringent starvation protein B